MKPMIGIVSFFSALLPALTLAATSSPPKAETTKPYYNSGYSFGLAGYSDHKPVANNLLSVIKGELDLTIQDGTEPIVFRQIIDS